MQPSSHEAGLGLGDIPGARPVGLEHRLKSADAFGRKLADAMAAAPLATVDEIAGRIYDALRYTVVASTQDYAEVMTKVLRRLAADFDAVKPLKSSWGGEGYQGITSTWRDLSTGQAFEVQLHTPESLAAREATFGMYERQRELPGDGAARVVARTLFYLLHLDADKDRTRPVGLVRECFDDAGHVDKAEALSSDGQWEDTNVLLSARRGDQTLDELEVDEPEAVVFERHLCRTFGLL